MAESTDSGSGLETYAPSIEVKLMDESKQPLKDIPHEDITSLEIDEHLEKTGMFRISLNDAVDLNTQKPRWSTDTDIQTKNMIKITISYASDPEKKTLSFVGRIISIEKEEGNEDSLKLVGFDLSYDMTKKDTNGMIYNDKKYSEIVTELAGNSQLKTDKIETSPITYENVIRYPGESDFDFLKVMSEEIGFEAFVQEESLHFRIPKDTLQGEVTLKQNWDIRKFNPIISNAACVSEVTVNSWDVKNKEMISETATLDDIKSGVGMKEFTTAAEKFSDIKKVQGIWVSRSAEEAKNMAVAELKRRNQDFITARLECIGNPKLRPGVTVKLEGVGTRFSGTYYIKQATHKIGKSGYFTTMSLRGCL
jgi:uncharacterized protein